MKLIKLTVLKLPVALSSAELEGKILLEPSVDKPVTELICEF